MLSCLGRGSSTVDLHIDLLEEFLGLDRIEVEGVFACVELAWRDS